ncbi:hypothetical protein ACM14_02785 [Delftia sp. JD2]|nr:hypothetical protein ACM14_02785 [Delftia sp. JD2]
MQTTIGGNHYLKIKTERIDQMVLIREGITAEATLRQEAQGNRDRIARLAKEADLFESAAMQLESSGAKPGVSRPNATVVADALERYLIAAATSVHWVTAPGVDARWLRSSVDWPDAPDISFLVDEDTSEGTLVYVMHHINRRDPSALLRLLTVKFLLKGKAAYAEASTMREFFMNMDAQKLVAEQDDFWPKAKSRS